VQLDGSATIPILYKKCTIWNNMRTFENTEPKVVEICPRKIEPEIGLVYTYPVRPEH
jgi:hypothetical protein